MRIVSWILRCYPRYWRARYQEEMLALLEQHTVTLKTLLDLFLGACEARLNALYRSKEETMFQRLRDNRSLSIIYLSAVALFLFSSSFWDTLGHGLAFQDNTLGSATNLLGALGIFFIPTICLVGLLGITGQTIVAAVKEHRWGILCFALVCVSITVWLLWAFFVPIYQFMNVFSLESLVTLFSALAWTLGPGCGLFIIGVKGVGLWRERQGWPLFFALCVGFLLPASMIAYTFWGQYSPDAGVQSTVMVPGGFSVGGLGFGSLSLFIQFLLMFFGPYLTLSALLLTLAQGHFSQRGWRIARVFGVVLVVLLLLELGIVAIWDINRWIGGGVWIFSPHTLVWTLFGDQWIEPLLALALILAITFVLALLALIRSFSLQVGRTLSVSTDA